MKKIIFTILLALTSPTFANAGSGSAIVPPWGTTSTTDDYSFVMVSNITNHELKVTVTVYSHNGTIISTAPGDYRNFGNNNATVAANNTAYIAIRTAAIDYGYAVITWQNNNASENDSVGLIAHGCRLAGTSWGYGIPIHNGLPF